VAEPIDYEHEARCAKFGFTGGAEQHVSCKLSRVELRHDQERLLAASIGSLERTPWRRHMRQVWDGRSGVYDQSLPSVQRSPLPVPPCIDGLLIGRHALAEHTYTPQRTRRQPLVRT
jgi:hypothetical protein